MQETQEEIFLLIGEYLEKQRPSIRNLGKDALLKLGRERLGKYRSEICKLLSSAQVQKLLDRIKDKDNEAEQTILDILGSLSIGIPPALLLKAILVLGRKWFCDE